MKAILLTLTLSMILYAQSTFSQYGDCFAAKIVCALDSFLITPSGFGTMDELHGNSVSNPPTNPNPIPGNNGCLWEGELNSAWVMFTIDQPGTLEWYFESHAGCLDWIMWPFDTNSCNAIINDSLPPIACNRNTHCPGLSGMVDSLSIPANGNLSEFETPINVSSGDQFVVLMNNYSSATTSCYFHSVGSATLVCNSPNSISSLGDKEILELYPNPANNIVRIKNYPVNADVRLFDSYGREVLYTRSREIDVSNLAAGAYVVAVSTNHKVLKSKLIVN